MVKKAKTALLLLPLKRHYRGYCFKRKITKEGIGSTEGHGENCSVALRATYSFLRG